tara:strand:+ start:153961 stop:154524 length:564 start_codon:yes stop_codon:yes gene_type:complete
MNVPTDMTPEFSKVLAVADVPPNGTFVKFDVSEAERAALAERFGLVAIHSFSGKVGVKPWRRHGLALEGSFTADVVQTCVVSLEPMDARVSENFSLNFLPLEMIERDAARAAESEIIVDVESADEPEVIENGKIDLGEAMSEQLALALDPYPRKPDAVPAKTVIEPEDVAEIRPNPFAALEKLKRKD